MNLKKECITFPACREKRKDCFAYCSNGTCYILTDTFFTSGCPFYKTDRSKTKQQEDKEKYEEIIRN